MEITESAHKWGISDADILHAFRNAVLVREVTWHGIEQVLIIGPALNGRLLELIAVPALRPTRIIHAMTARGKFLRLFKGDA